MRARAPGKLVISGAYAVLEGAPALVAAVDRYVVAEVSRTAELITDEVAEAMRRGVLDVAPWFDASALRAQDQQGDRKLGLGSSAAILAASIGASWLARGATEADLGQKILEVALPVHRAAQHGGSGIDVAAACRGGVLRCQLSVDGAATGGEPQIGRGDDPNRLTEPPLKITSHELPKGLWVDVYQCSSPASTPHMLRAVAAFCDEQRDAYNALMAGLGRAASRAADEHEPQGLVEALWDQTDLFSELGRVAGVPIVTHEMVQLGAIARAEGACFVPSGAGGGDVAMWIGGAPSSEAFKTQARLLGLAALPMSVGARGVHRAAV